MADTMFKRTLLTVALASRLMAASWDGTKGNITLTTTGTPGLTKMEIQSTDLSVRQFLVVIFTTGSFVPGSGLYLANKVTAPHSPAFNAPAKLTLHLDESEISTVIITEVHPGETQQFGGIVP